ncbi:MAG: hypothetical protein WD250_13190 [Egibacteraceae bacterium]
MAIEAERVTVTDTAVALNDGIDDHIHGYSVLVTNRAATTSIDLGPSGVTSGAGVELKAGESISLDLTGGDVIYAVAPALETPRVDVLRVGV